VVGIGPASQLDRTRRAEMAIAESTAIFGYKYYTGLITDLTEGKEVISSGMTQERERCRKALRKAETGTTVSLISSGDPGIYGMAGLAIEMAARESIAVTIEVIPGVSAANAAASRLGAPLMLDFASISLSDLLVPWEMILKRLEAVAQADLVVALYNPRSKKRIKQLIEAVAIFKRYRKGTTPVGVCTAVGTAEERVVFSTLDQVLDEEVTMKSIVIVGNNSSELILDRFVTPRGYQV